MLLFLIIILKMIPYLTILILLFAFPFLFRLCYKGKKNVNLFLSLFSFLLLYFLLAFKGIPVGTDISLSYYPKYLSLKNVTFSSLFSIKSEFGLYAIMKLFSLCGANYLVFQCFFYFVVLFPFWLFCYKFSKFPELFALSFYCLDLYNLFDSALREVGAISLVMLGIYFLYKKNRWGIIVFLICVFTAFFFHHSSIVALLIIPVSRLRMEWKQMISFGIPFYVAFILLSPYAYEGLYGYYNYYYPGANYGSFPSFSFAIFLALVFFTFFFPDSVLFKKMASALSKTCITFFAREEQVNFVTIDPDEKIVFTKTISIIFVGSLLMSMSSVTYVGVRLCYYFISLLPLAISNYPAFFSNKKASILIRFSFSLALSAFFLYAFLYKNPLGGVPYVFYF